MKSGKYKTVTYDTVKDTVLDLINKNNYTTNLDTKNALRQNGFFVKEYDVRDFMDEILVKEPTLLISEDVTTKGIMHRKFMLSSFATNTNDSIQAILLGTVTVSPTVTLQQPQQKTYKKVIKKTLQATNNIVNTPVTSTLKSYTDRNGNIFTEKLQPDTTGDWIITSTGIPIIMYFNGLHTRDQVRNAYAKINGVKIQTTRSIRF